VTQRVNLSKVAIDGIPEQRDWLVADRIAAADELTEDSTAPRV